MSYHPPKYAALRQPAMAVVEDARFTQDTSYGSWYRPSPLSLDPMDANSAPASLEIPSRPSSACSSRAETTDPLIRPDSMSDHSYDLEAKHDEAAEEWKPSRQELLIMISLSFISLMVALDATVLVTVLPEIAHKLNGTSIEAFWAGTSYLLTSAIFQPVIASISSLFGRQQLLLASLVFFTVGTVLCAVAEGFGMMLTGRCIQGVGGGGIITLTQVIFCDLVPLRQRPKYFSMVLGSWSIGSMIGPVIGGVLVEKASWRWCFHINYPFCGAGFLIAIFIIRLSPVDKLTLAQKLGRVDWLGAFIFVGSMTSFLVGLSWGGIQHPWKSAATLAPIVAGLFGLILFFVWQLYRKTHTLLPLSVFYNWSAIAAFFSALINGLILFTALYYYPFYEMTVRGSSATMAGVNVLPAVCLLVPGSIIVSLLTARFGRFRWAIWSGWAITSFACGLMILFDMHTNTIVLRLTTAVFGIGTGMVLTSVNVGIQAISRTEDSAMAASMYGFFRSLGMPLGVALAGSIFQNAMSDKLVQLGLPTAIAHDSERYIFVLRQMTDMAKKMAILQAYVAGFQAVFTVVTIIAGVALVSSFVIQRFSMDKKLSTQFTAR